MADIKVKEDKKSTIKTLNKSIVGTQKLKNKIAKNRKAVTNNSEEVSEIDYAMNRMSNTAENTLYNMKKFNKYGKAKYDIMKRKTGQLQNLRYHMNKLDFSKKRKNIKSAYNPIKKKTNMVNTSEKMVRTTKQTVKHTTKVAQKTAKMMKITAKNLVKVVKTTVKATVTTIKAIIAGTKLLIASLIAGGWIVALIVIIVCMVAMLCNSIFGIFFSNENVQDSGISTMSVISDLNNEFVTKINEIQKNTKHDEFDINTNRAEWKDILSIYTAKISKGKDETDVMFLTEKKGQELRAVFWEMNNISSNTTKEIREITITDENGNTKTEKVEHTILHITVTGKSIKEMEQLYKFSNKQKLQVAELLNDKYAKMWSNLLYGSSIGSNDIVSVAKQQVGNIGGQPYWSWYGFKNRVEWCACFVSWCANQCGYIERGIIPKFSGCQVEGVAWFKTCGLWKERGYVPQAGDIIFFDWVGDGKANHVGIVEKVENEKVYTIEGNSGNDMCREKNYNLDSKIILGYGTPMY